MKFGRFAVSVVALGALLAFTSGAKARQRLIAANPNPGQGGMVNLPYQVPDSQGTTWMLYGSGWLQQQAQYEPIPFGLRQYWKGHLVGKLDETMADALIAAMRECGCDLNNAYMQHSLLALVVIPELRISDIGLVDVTRFQPTALLVG